MERQVTKLKKGEIKVTAQSNERHFRQQIAQGVSGTHLGLWLLVPFLLKLEVWQLLEDWLGKDPLDLRMGLQLVNEAALCTNRLRAKNTFCHQGFALSNGLSFLPTDKQIHLLCNPLSIQQSQALQLALARQRFECKHYHSPYILAIDPHRIPTASKRIMAKKKKKPEQAAQKMVQTFFCNDAITGQPLCSAIGSSGVPCTKAGLELLGLLDQLPLDSAMLLADTEHFTLELLSAIKGHPRFDILLPAPNTARIQSMLPQLDYREHWPGYAIGSGNFKFAESDQTFHLIAQRTGLKKEDLLFKPFISTFPENDFTQINQQYPKRWTIEEFFNFDGPMRWDRASTLNLNIQYAKQTAALIAQAACFELKSLLPQPFSQWTALHTAETCFLGLDGNLKVVGDTIKITFYNVPKELNLHQYFSNLPAKLRQQGINPNVPWLYGFKIDFVFR